MSLDRVEKKATAHPWVEFSEEGLVLDLQIQKTKKQRRRTRNYADITFILRAFGPPDLCLLIYA